MSNTTSETIYNEVVKRFERELERASHLDDKTNNIIGFVGILTGIISGFGAFTLKIPTNNIEIAIAALFIISLLSLFASFIFGLNAYFPKKFTMIPDPYFLIGKYAKANQDQVIRDLSDNYAVAVEDNMKINDCKSTSIKRAVLCLFFTIIFFSLFALGFAFSH